MDYVPFVFADTDCEILGKFYSDCFAVRLSLETIEKTNSKIPPNIARWLDPTVDGLHRWPAVAGQYLEHLRTFPNHERIGDRAFHERPDKRVVAEFVESVLNACVQVSSLRPDWLSIVQLPYVADSSRNKINRYLAEACATWKVKSGFRGRFILPAILTHQRQIRLKSERNKKIRLLHECFELSGAEGLWIVESSLNDQEGATTIERRFGDVIGFHEETRTLLPLDIVAIGGPYWALNQILWAKNLIGHPAIGAGRSFQYYLPGGMMKPGKNRLALTPLLRLAVASPELLGWLKRAISRIPEGDDAHSEFADLVRNFQRYQLNCRVQVAGFYKKWFSKTAAQPPAGRPLSLYQQFSSAYVVGKTLPELPRAEESGRKADRVPRQFMVNCL